MYREQIFCVSRKRAFSLLGLIYCITLVGCTQPNDTLSLKRKIEQNAQQMDVVYQVVSNTETQACDQNLAYGECYRSRLTLTFTESLPDSGWSIYFSRLSPIQQVKSEHFSVEHINGDLHKITPTQLIDGNQAYVIELVSGFWSVAKTDVLPNYFFAFNESQTAVIKATEEYIDPHRGVSVLPHVGDFDTSLVKRNIDDLSEMETATSIFTENENRHVHEANKKTNQRILPFLSNQIMTQQYLDVTQGISINLSSSVSQSVLETIFDQFNLIVSQAGVPVRLKAASSDAASSKDAYTIMVSDTGIDVSSNSESGYFYALVSLAQLVDDEQKIQFGTYTDSPAYSFRGIHLDVSRNFRSLEFVKTLLDEMAILKLNKFHFHLADDEGWRLEIPGLPELTQVGAYRCFDLSENNCLLPQLGAGPNRESSANGYFSREQYIDILKYAQQRHIEVIPSLDMPGHSRAAIKAMEARYAHYNKKGNVDKANEFLLTEFADVTQYRSVQHYNDNTLNPCLPSTKRFVVKVLNEVFAMHEEAGVALKRYHIGADETAGAWSHSPACMKYIANNEAINNVNDLTPSFISQVTKYVESKGATAAGWSDGMATLLSFNKSEHEPLQTQQSLQVNVWSTLYSKGHMLTDEFLQDDWKTILSYPDVLYFDFPYSISPDEPGYYWASRATDSFKVHSFMPNNPQLNALLWKDRMNKAYNGGEAKASSARSEGIQAHLWSEVVRHDSVAEYMYFPRLVAFAQKAWHEYDWQQTAKQLSEQELKQQINKSWQLFSATMTNYYLPRLASLGINFRVPPPGAKIHDNTLYMNHEFPNTELFFSVDGVNFRPYQQPFEIDKTEVIYVKSRFANRESLTLELPIKEQNMANALLNQD